jgi:hypothetical protein
MNWAVPKIWEGGDVWIIGGGPSVPQLFEVPPKIINNVLDGVEPVSAYSPYLEPLHTKHVVGINAAFLIGNWIDAVFFGDSKFFLKYMKELQQFHGLKVCCASNAARFAWVKYLQRDGRKPYGISSDSSKVSWNQNSGAAAISMCVHSGAKRIFLLGFDMKLGAGNSQHWHTLYRDLRKVNGNRHLQNRLPFRRHLKGFPLIAEDAKRMGVEIYNVCPDSAIESFPKVHIKEVL